MANRFAVATGNWSSTGTWSATDGGASGASFPTAADDAFLTATSGVITVTVDVASACRSIDCTGFTGTLTFASNILLSVGTSTVGPGNVAVKLGAGMTLTKGNINAGFQYVGTNATTQTFTSNGINAGRLVVNGGATAVIQLQDNLSLDGSSSTFALTLSAGGLDTNGKTVTAGALNINGGGTKVLTLGASPLNLSNATAVDTSGASGLTVTANTGTVTASAVNGTFIAGGFNFNGLSVSFTGSGTSVFSGGGTFKNVTRVGTAVKTDGINFSGNTTTTGTITLTGNSLINRLLVGSTSLGTTATLTAALAPSLTNVDFQDIAGAGAAAPLTGTSLGDAWGNSGITFDAPVTSYWVGGAGNWTDITHWASSSGGAGSSGRIPLPQDTARLDSVASGTVTSDTARIARNLDFTGFTRTFSPFNPSNLYGSLTLGASMSVGGWNLTLLGRGSHTYTTAGISSLNPSFNGFGGTYTLQDILLCGGLTISGSATLTTNNFNMTCSTLTTSGVSTLNGGTSVISVSGSGGGIWNLTASYTMNLSTATVQFTAVSGSSRTLGGTGVTYGTFKAVTADTGTIVISGVNTYGTLDVEGNKTFQLLAANTQTVTSALTLLGTSFASPLTLNSSSGGSAATISAGGGVTINVQRISIVDNTGSGGASFLAYNSILGSNVTGWNGAGNVTINVTATVTIASGNVPAVIRWNFTDSFTSETYTFEMNPDAGGLPANKKHIQYQNTAAPNGATLYFEGRDEPLQGEFTGTILTYTFYQSLLKWYQKRHQFVMTDDNLQTLTIYPTEFTVKRVRSATYPYKMTYSFKYTVIQ